MKTQAIVFPKPNEIEVIEIELPKLGDYDVLYKTEYTSICTLDRRAWLGTRSFKYPFLGGHESSGVVIDVGSKVFSVKAGDKVIVTSAYCMQCEMDRENKETQCLSKDREAPRVLLQEGKVQGGAFSEYLVVPVWQIMKLPEDSKLLDYCLIEPLACCVHSIRKARIQIAETVLIIGFGIMGYFHCQLARMQGARVIVSEPDPQKRELAIKSGAHVVIHPMDQKKYQSQIDVIVNTVPFKEVWENAYDMLKPYGRLIAYSSQNTADLIGVDYGRIHSKEFEIIGTINPNIQDNDTAIKLISYSLINTDLAIDSVYEKCRYQEAFKRSIEPGLYRVVLKFGETK